MSCIKICSSFFCFKAKLLVNIKLKSQISLKSKNKTQIKLNQNFASEISKYGDCYRNVTQLVTIQ